MLSVEEVMKEIIGMTREGAERITKDNGLRLRVTREDGNRYIGTKDYVPTRIDVAFENGKVVSAGIG